MATQPPCHSSGTSARTLRCFPLLLLSSSRRIVEDLPSRGWVLRGCFRPPLRPSISILVRFLRFAGGAVCWGSYHPVAVMLVHLPVLICESSFERSSVSRNMQPQWTGHFISPATGTPYPQAPSLGSTVWLPGGQTLFIFLRGQNGMASVHGGTKCAEMVRVRSLALACWKIDRNPRLPR